MEPTEARVHYVAFKIIDSPALAAGVAAVQAWFGRPDIPRQQRRHAASGPTAWAFPTTHGIASSMPRLPDSVALLLRSYCA
jgi:hypothetical protein